MENKISFKMYQALIRIKHFTPKATNAEWIKFNKHGKAGVVLTFKEAPQYQCDATYQQAKEILG